MDNNEIQRKMLELKEKSNDAQKNIKNIKYVNDLEIIPQIEEYRGWIETDLYIVEAEKDIGNEESQEIYEIYNNDGELIATTNENGDMTFEEKYLEDLEKIIDEQFKGIMEYEDLGIAEKDREINLENILEGKEEELIELDAEELELDFYRDDSKELENEEKYKIEQEDKKVQPEQTSEEELQKLGNGWENYVRRIEIRESDPIYEDLEELEKPLYIAENRNGDFEAVTQGQNGEPVKSKIINSSRSTMQPVMHIDNSGKPVQEMVPTAVMDTYKSNIKLSVKFELGYMEAQKLQRAHDNRYIATDLDKVGNRDKTYDVRYQTDKTKQGRDMAENLADNFEERDQEGDNNIELDEIDINIEDIKRQIIDDALENYNDMSPQELREYIRNELIENLGEDDSHIEEFTEEIKAEVEDEARVPQRGEMQ